jgi:hypothetical protein
MPQPTRRLTQAEQDRIRRNMTAARVDPNYRPTTLASVIHEEAEKDARRRVARMDNIEQKRKQFLFWSRSLDEIAQDPDVYTAGFDDIGLSMMSESEIETDERKVAAHVKEVVTEFLSNLTRRRGLFLTWDARTRVICYASVQCMNGVRIDAYALEVMFDRLKDDLQAIIPEEVKYFPDHIVPEKPKPQPKPTLTEQLETLNLETDAGRAKAKSLVENEVYGEAGKVWRRWQEWLAVTYNVRLTDEEKHFILNDLIPRNGWSYTDDRTYDRVRYYLCTTQRHKTGARFGRWGYDMLSETERHNLKIEAIDKPLDRLTPREKFRLIHPDEF